MAFLAPEDELEAAEAFSAPADELLAPAESIESQQTPLETGARATGSGGVQSVTSVLSGAGQVQKSISDVLRKNVGDLPAGYFDALTSVPRLLGPAARKVGDAAEQFFAPDRELNPKSATVGSALGQMPVMIGGTVVAGPAAPLIMGGFSGYDQGIQQAEQMGIDSPEKRAAMGLGFGATEVLTEKMFGFGSKAATAAMRDALRRSAGQMGKSVLKSTLGEGVEEIAAGVGQNALSLGMAPQSYDSTDLRPFVPGTWDVNQNYLTRRGHEALGGAVGGAMFGAVDAGLNLAKPRQELGAVADPLAAHAATMPETFSAPAEEIVTDDARFMPPEAVVRDSGLVIGEATPAPNPQPPTPALAAPFTNPNELAPVEVGAGNVFIDLPKTPEALAAQRADEEKLAEIRGKAQIIATQKDKPPVIPDAPYGGYDVLDFVNENIIHVPPADERTGGEYDWTETASIPPQYNKYLFHAKRGKAIDKVAQMAYEENLISDPTADALLAAIESTIQSRDTYTAEMAKREAALSEEEQATRERESTWADSVIAESMETPFIGIDPKLMAAYTVKGAQLIREGFTTFAKWSREMLSRFGNAVKDYLQGAWQAAMKTSEQGFVGTGEIKLTHEAEAARMEAEGKEPLPTGGQGTVEEWEAEAAQRVQEPGAAGALVTDIIAQQRPATPVEYYMLQNYGAALDAELARVDGILADPATSPEARAAAAETKRTQDAERDRVAVAAQLAGSKAGASLGARSRGLDRSAVPSLAKMVADITLIQDPTGRTPLPPEERAVIEKTHAKLETAAAAVEKQEEEGIGGARNTYNEELQKLLKEAQEEIAAQKEQLAAQEHALNVQPGKVKLYTRSKEKLKAWSADGKAAQDELLRMIGVRTNMTFGIEMMPQLARIVRGFIADGFLTTDAIAKKLVKAVPPEFYNSLKNFLPQIIDAADKLQRDELKKKTPDDIKAKMRDIKAKGKDLPGDIARKFALAHIVDHLERNDKTLSAEKIAKLVAKDLQEFLPGVTERQARDLISGYGKVTTPSKEEARKTLRDLAAQMQKLTQLEILQGNLGKLAPGIDYLNKSGPQRDEPSARVRELIKQIEALKKDTGYNPPTKADMLKSARDRIKKSLENQIEELQRILAGKAAPVTTRDKIAYDADLNALKTLRNSLKDLVAELPAHKLATEERRNKAALKAALASEAEWKRRAEKKEWKRPGDKPFTHTQEVIDAKAKAKEARANFEALKKAADPRNNPEAVALRQFKSRVQSQIKAINEKIRTGAYDPPKKTPRQIKHDAESDKLKHDLELKKREWIDLKLKHEWEVMSMPKRAIERLRTLLHTARSIMTGGEFSGLLRQGMFKTVSHPIRVFGNDVPAMFKAFFSEAGETSVMNAINLRANALNGRYKLAKLAIHSPTDYSSLMAEGNARSRFANKIPFIAGTGRAYTTLSNHMRADLFDMMVDKLTKKGNPPTDAQLKAIGEFVNDSTGAGKLGAGSFELPGGYKDALSAVFFSPAYVASRMRMLLGASLWGGDMKTRQIIAGEYLRITAGMAAVYALLSALAGHKDDEDDDKDPRSSQFLKIKVGQHSSLDIMAGLSQIAVLFAREAMGQMVKDGKVYNLRPIDGKPVPYGQPDMGDVLGKFIRSKLSPGAGFAWNRLTGTDFSGKPTTLRGDLGNLVVPLTAGQIKEAWQHERPEVAAPLSAAAMFGIGVNTFPPRQ